MTQSVSNDVADRMRAFAWRIRPALGQDDPADKARNKGRGLGDTIAMIIAAGHRPELTKGTNLPFAAYKLSKYAAATETLKDLIRAGQASGPVEDGNSHLEIADGIHAWVAPDGKVITGPMKDGVYHDHAVAISEQDGDWLIEMRTSISEATRKLLAGKMAAQLEDLLEPVSGKVTCTCYNGGVEFYIDSRVDKRDGDIGGARRSCISDIAIRYDPTAVEQKIATIVSNVREAYDAYQLRMARAYEMSGEIERHTTGHGFHLRMSIEDTGNEIRLTATHLGRYAQGELFPQICVKTLNELEQQLAIGLERAKSGDFYHLRRFGPDAISLDGRNIDAALLMMVRELAPDDTGYDALRRIIAHGDRNWTTQHLSDLFGRQVDAHLSIDIQNDGTVRAIMQLSDDVTIKRGILVIRRNRLPDTILEALKDRRVREVVEHRWMPDAMIERATASAGVVGATYSLALTPAYGQVEAMRQAA